MPKGYWIARIDVTDLDQYKKYVAANAMPLAKFGARFLVRAGSFETFEGSSRTRNVVIEFASLQDAHDCYHSPEYTAAREFRDKAGKGEFILVEGAE